MFRRARERKSFFLLLVSLIAVACGLSVFSTVSYDSVSESAFADNSLYSVFTQSEFDEFTNYVLNNPEYDFSGCTVNLYCNVTVPRGFVIRSFNGTFNGNGYSLFGMNRNMIMKLKGTFKNVCIEEFNIEEDFPVVVSTNYGTVENVRVSSSYVLKNGTSGIIDWNESTGVVRNLSVDLTTEGSRIFNYNRGLIENSIINVDMYAGENDAYPLIFSCGGTFRKNVYVGLVNTTGNVYPFGKGSAENCVLNATTQTVTEEKLVLRNEENILYDVKSSYSTLVKNVSFDISGNITETTLDDLSAINSLTDGFITVNGFYPIIENIFTGSGTEDAPFSIESHKAINDFEIFKKYEQSATVYAVVNPSLKTETDGKIYYADKNAYADYIAIKNAITEVNVATDGYVNGNIETVLGSETSGIGTEADPFVISTAEELVGFLKDGEKNISGKYAVLTRNISINNAVKHNRILDLDGCVLNAVLDGTGKEISNLNETFIGKISGTLKNIEISFVFHEDAYGAVCEEVTESGTLTKVVTHSLNNGFSVKSGIALKNNGTINLCTNYVSAEYAFSGTQTENGEITNCSDKGSCEKFSGNNFGSLCVSDGKVLIDGEIIETETDIDTLESLGFDMEFVFGYEKGMEINVPSVRLETKNYRTRILDTVKVNNYPEILRNIVYTVEFVTNPDGTVTMNELEALPITSCQEYVCIYENAKFIWTYTDTNNVTSTPTSLKKVGKYSLKVVLEEGDDYLPAEVAVCFAKTDDEIADENYGIEVIPTYTFEIKKATLKEGIRFESFGNLTDKYTYIGEEIDFSEDEPLPSNYQKLISAGFSLTYSYSETPFFAGTYVQTITAKADNFNEISRSRKITVNKANLEISISDIETDYLQNVDFDSAQAEMSVDGKKPLGVDFDKTFVTLLNESGYLFKDVFITDYVMGNGVGEYPYSCTINEIKNYVIMVSTGNIKVVPIDLPLDDIIFENKTVTYDGNAHSIKILDLPKGYSVKYDGNAQIDVGEYTITATISVQNYNDAVTYATLNIQKAELLITISSFNAKYGYELNLNDFSYEISGFVGTDTKESVMGETVIEIAVGESEDGMVLNAGKYDVVPILPEEPLNYGFTFAKGELSIDKIPLSGITMDGKTVEYSGEKITCEALVPEEYVFNVSYYYENSKNETSFDGMIDSGSYTVTATVIPQGETAVNYETVEVKCTLTIVPLTVKVFFESSDGKTVTYNGQSHAKAEYFPFIAEGVDVSEVKLSFETSSGAITEAVNAGKYFVSARYEGDRNHSACVDTVSLTVKPKEADIDIETVYEYTSEGIPMIIKGITYDNGGEPFIQEDVSYTYVYNQYGNELPTGSLITSVGEYTVTAKSKNPNYTVISEPFIVTITKKDVSIEVGSLSIEYGTQGEYKDENGNTVVVYGGFFTHTVLIEETGKRQELTFTIPLGTEKTYWQANRYTLNESMLGEVRNYNITLKGTNELIVKRRKLNVYWKHKNIILKTYSAQTTYNGTEITSDVAYEIGNYAYGEGLAHITVVKSIKLNAQDSIIRNVGEYNINLTLKNTPNYEFNMETSSFTFTVKQSNVFVTVNNCEVMYLENLHTPTITVTGLLGDDIGKDPATLAGFRYKTICDYRVGAVVGTTFRITGEYSFMNYEVGTVTAGTLMVVNGYPSYTLPSATFIYDGTEKTVVIPSVEEGTRVIYSNNAHTTAGEYTASATVIYPTGRRVGLSAKLTILPATPFISCPINYTVYEKNKLVSNADITAVATHNGKTVNGTFDIISEDKLLKTGTNNFTLMFKPSDAVNYTTARVTLTMVAYEISSANILFSNLNYALDEDGKLNITQKTQITLSTASCPGIAEELKLCYNGQQVEMIVVEKTEKFTVSIQFKDKMVYSTVLDVVYTEGKLPEKPQETIEISHTMLSYDGIKFSGDEIIMLAQEGKIAMSEKYSGDYAVYVNGKVVADIYTIKSTEKKLGIIIVNKKLGISMYNKEFSVISSDEWEERNNQSLNPGEEDEGEFKSYYYYIIGAAAALLVGGGAVLVILLLKKRK